MWRRRKISEPWKDGVVLTFRSDLNENTVVYQKGDSPAKSLWNVLAFTNNRKNPDFIRLLLTAEEQIGAIRVL